MTDAVECNRRIVNRPIPVESPSNHAFFRQLRACLRAAGRTADRPALRHEPARKDLGGVAEAETK